MSVLVVLVAVGGLSLAVTRAVLADDEPIELVAAQDVGAEIELVIAEGGCVDAEQVERCVVDRRAHDVVTSADAAATVIDSTRTSTAKSTSSSEIVNGGALTFVMGPEPNRSWASSPESTPYSMSRR